MCCVFAMWWLCTIVGLCLYLIVYDSYLPHFSFCLLSSAGKQRICLIILNQPLDKDYLDVLWSKGTHQQQRSNQRHLFYFRFHLHWFAPSVFSPFVFFFWLCSLACLASTVQNLNCGHVIENAPSLPSSHNSREMCFNKLS